MQFYQEELLEPITNEEELLLTKFLLHWLSLNKESDNIINDYKKKYWNCKIELFKKVSVKNRNINNSNNKL